MAFDYIIELVYKEVKAGENAQSREEPAMPERFSAPPASPSESPRFYSVAQVARLMGMSQMTVYRAIDSGDFPAVRVRGRLIIPARAIEAMIDAAVIEQTVVDSARWGASTRNSGMGA